MTLDLAVNVAGIGLHRASAGREPRRGRRCPREPLTDDSAYALSGYAAALARSGSADEAIEVGWRRWRQPSTRFPGPAGRGHDGTLWASSGRSTPPASARGWQGRWRRGWRWVRHRPPSMPAGGLRSSWSSTIRRGHRARGGPRVACRPRGGRGDGTDHLRLRYRLGAAGFARHQAAGNGLDDDQVSRLAASLAEALAEPGYDDIRRTPGCLGLPSRSSVPISRAARARCETRFFSVRAICADGAAADGSVAGSKIGS